MQTLFSNKRKWILLSLLILIIMISSYVISSEKPKNYPSYVSHSPSPTGVKAFYTYLDKEVGSVSRWSLPPNLLPKDEANQLVVMLEPSVTPNSDEMNEYIEFMEAGNTILLFQENPRDIFDLAIHFHAVAESDNQLIIGQDGREYESELHTDVFLQPNEEDEVLLHNQAGLAVALKRQYGNGQLIVANNPNWMLNEHILSADHLPLLITLFNEIDANKIYFNEYIHGEQDTSIFNVYPKWFLLLIIQGSILICLLLWIRGKRFGFSMIPREETVRFSDERIRALASWHLKSQRYHDSLQIQADYVKLLLQERWGISYNRSWLEIEDSLERKWRNVSKPTIHQFVTELSNLLNEEKISKYDYVLWSKKLEQLRKEVEEG
ncbi:DUF4350 domain-containing protein [Metabacillus sp. 22489]|uniref:DUF4350 domain-containing protein n=1 Tax=Metabacillus sp. 22489 TaxID=3453928 RepID=UPI003F8722F1